MPEVKVTPIARERIDVVLKHLEMIHNIDILYAVEYGSRSWNSHSADSDYDVRFIFRRRGGAKPYLLRVPNRPDHIREEFPQDALDLQGWDIDKFSDLAVRSNFQVWEMLHSDVIYRNVGEFKSMVMKCLDKFYCPRSTYFATTEIGRREFAAIQALSNVDERVNTKKLFYSLRHWLMADYIYNRGRWPEDMNVEYLVNTVESGELKEAMLRCIELKRIGHKGIAKQIAQPVCEFIELRGRLYEKRKATAPVASHTPYCEALNLMEDLIKLEINK